MSTNNRCVNRLPNAKSNDFLDRIFLKENDIASVVSVSDTCTTDGSGATIGIVRMIAYEN